jgi:hypothetical protein
MIAIDQNAPSKMAKNTWQIDKDTEQVDNIGRQAESIRLVIDILGFTPDA